jgi:GAF domain-containing protein
MSKPQPLSILSDKSRAEDVAHFFVEMLNMMRTRKDATDVFTFLASRAEKLVDAEASAVVLFDELRGPQIVGVSRHEESIMELLQVHVQEGPASQCRTAHEMVADVSLDPSGPWPKLSLLCREQGFAATYAFPLSSHIETFGVLVLLAKLPLPENQLPTAQILADTATVAFLQAERDSISLLTQTKLASAMTSLTTLEHAKGMLAHRYKTTPDLVFATLWQLSLDTDTSLTELAGRVVNRTLDAQITEELDAHLG